MAAVQQLGFPSDKILLLLDREATKQRIEQVLYGTLRRASPEDRVLVFFAGHGLTASLPRGGEEGFLLPVDGDPDDLPLTAIAMEDVRKIARRIPAKHILFTVDACYSGFAISRDILPTRVDSAYLQAVTKEPAVQIITAGRKGEPVLEEEGHGLFTRRLLAGLTGLADTDQNGIITAQELATWLESRVVRDSQDRQHPQYSRLDGEGQFVFVIPGRERAPSTAISDEREKLKEELKRVAEEAERLKRDRGLFAEERKLAEEKQKIELAKLEAERTRLKAEAERLALEKGQSEKVRQEAERKRLVEEAAKVELAKLEAERARLKTEEERIAKEKTASEEVRLEAERKRQSEEATKAGQPQVVAKLPSLPARPPVALPKVAELPKYGVGDSWTVRFPDGRTATRKIRAIEKDQYVFEWGLDLWRYYDRDLVLRRQTTPEDGKDVVTYLLKQRTIDFPLSANKTWEFRILVATRPLGGGHVAGINVRFYQVFSFKILGSESVSTPAGTFGAFKIEERSGEIRCVTGEPCEDVAGALTGRYRHTVDQHDVRHWWYAPEAKSVVKVKRMSGVPTRDQEPDYELVGYELVGEQKKVVAELKQPTGETVKSSLRETITKLSSPSLPSRPPVALPTGAELPKYSVGDSWTLRFGDGRTVTRKVRAIEKDLYVFEWGPFHRRYLDRELVLREETSLGSQSPYLLNQRAVDFPLSVNKTWEFRILVAQRSIAQNIDVRFYQVYSYKVLGTETLETAVGSFGAFKIEETSSENQCSPSCETVANSTVVRHLWWAPEAKFVVKVEHISGDPRQGQEPDYELVALELK